MEKIQELNEGNAYIKNVYFGFENMLPTKLKNNLNNVKNKNQKKKKSKNKSKSKGKKLINKPTKIDEQNDVIYEPSPEKEEKKEKNKKFDQKDYEKLNKNYLELERKILLLEKEKEELTSCLKKLYLEKTANSKIPTTFNNEENINDLMFLVNNELKNKDKIIHDLEGKVSKVDLKNIEKCTKEQLMEYKDLYTKNLKKINDAIKQYS